MRRSAGGEPDSDEEEGGVGDGSGGGNGGVGGGDGGDDDGGVSSVAVGRLEGQVAALELALAEARDKGEKTEGSSSRGRRL